VAVIGDVREDADVERAVATAVDRFGGVDIVVNNASAIDLRPTSALDMKRYDLMQDINVRGSFLLTKTCLPHLARPRTRTSSRCRRPSTWRRAGRAGTWATRWPSTA
jgi:NAD(P)-dependent dehydrogenase (short-subunit alcohol dehydrogenase family)